jgi:ABC-type Fe3+ transport system permease subunit
VPILVVVKTWIRSRPADVVALAAWVVAPALVVLAEIVGPEGECEFGNKDAYVAAAHRSGVALAGAAVALVAAASFLAAGAMAKDRARGARLVRGVGALVSLVLAALIAVVALLELVGFGCLE